MRPILIAMILLLGGAAAAATDYYHLRYDPVQPDHVGIEAEFALSGDVIGMFVIASPQLPNGSADLVADLVVRNAAGSPLDVENLGVGDWRVTGAQAGDRVRVSYRVALRHGEYDWSPGIDEVAYRTDDGLFFAGRALWIIPFDGLADGVTISFDLPDGWRASTPWPREQGRSVADLHTLVSNCFFLGTHHEETVRFDAFTFVFALGNELADRSELFASTIRPVLPRAREIFGGMPRESRYLVVINRYPRTDGGAYSQSYSMLIDGPVNEAGAVIWGHGIVHEVLHFWNGHTLRREGSGEEWFSEGITDYLTVLLRSQLEQDRPEVTWRKFENALRRVILSRMMMGNSQGLDAAGEQKQQNRMLVYGGGLLAGLALDVELRTVTGGADGLPTLLQRLYHEFALEDRTYTTADIQRVASEIAGKDMNPFFDRYVRGGGVIDYRPVFARLGLQLDTMVEEFYLSPRAGADAEADALRRAILGR